MPSRLYIKQHRDFLFLNLGRESLPGADLVPRPLGVRALQPVSRSQKFWCLPGLFYFPRLLAIEMIEFTVKSMCVTVRR